MPFMVLEFNLLDLSKSVCFLLFWIVVNIVVVNIVVVNMTVEKFKD